MWEPAEDNIGIKNYILRRNGVVIALPNAETNRFTDENLTASTDYTYTITAIDLAENASAESVPFTIRTLNKAGTGGFSSSSSKTSSLSSKSQSSTSQTSSATTSKSSSSLSKSSNSNSSSSQRSTSSSLPGINLQTIKIVWSHPDKRENGTYLELDNIGGYEIRYRKPGDKHFTYFSIPGNRVTEFSYIGDFTGAVFEIAVYDSEGLYSRFSPVAQ